MAIRFIAQVNVPGYLPQDDEPPIFTTAREAWEYLAAELDRAGEAYEPMDESDPDGPQQETATYARLIARAESDRTGYTYGPTPDSDSTHDLGMAYGVNAVKVYPHEADYRYIITNADGVEKARCRYCRADYRMPTPIDLDNDHTICDARTVPEI